MPEETEQVIGSINPESSSEPKQPAALAEKRPRGRPRKGLKFRERTKERWQPAEWRPEYVEIVSLSCSGMSNKMIAELKSLTPQQISNILNTEEGKTLRTFVRDKWMNDLKSSVPENITGIQAKAFKVINAILEDEDVKKRNPISLLREAANLLKGIGTLRPDGPVINNNITQTNAALAPEVLGNVLDALESGKRVRERYDPEPKQLASGS